MFNNLSNNLSKIFDKLRGKVIITEDDINIAMREIRIALLEADVNIKVVKNFIESIKEKALNQEVIKNISPVQQIIKIVHDEIVEILGKDNKELIFSSKPPIVIMMVGLQGAGKTLTSAKIANKYKHNKKILLASVDIYRPAAQEQLKILADKINVDSLEIIKDQKPLDIARRALNIAEQNSYDLLILDTAGRLQTDDELMNELEEVKEITNPKEILLVADSLTGQEAVNIAEIFNNKLNLSGIILTRFDGDAKGGVALSMKYVTGCPIKFIGIGEKPEDLGEFHPERAANRILDMGDIVSLVEKARDIMDLEESEKLAKKMARGEFDMNDMLSQMKNIKKMGGIGGFLSFLPGIGKMAGELKDKVDEKLIDKQMAIILSMTKKERKNPKIINGTRRKRIAAGSGTIVNEVNILIRQYNEMNNMMKKLKQMGPKNLMKNFNFKR